MKPKDLEKKQFGEVFTPLDFINKMFDQLDFYYKSQNNGNSIFNNKKLIWFDPACGIGNFEVILFERLMKGLKDQFTHEDLLKKHILENMIYVSELNKKNVFIYKTIFNLHRKYKLNILLGDSLKINLQKKYFDIIIGNPPFNHAPTSKSHYVAPYYPEFIEYFIDKCQIMMMITPNKWLIGGKNLTEFWEKIKIRIDIPLIKNYENSTEVFPNNPPMSSGICYFIKDSEYKKGLTKFNDKIIKLNNYDIIVEYKYNSIIDKMLIFINKNGNLEYNSSSYYNITPSDSRLHDNKENNNKYLKCYVSKTNGNIKYIKKSYIDQNKLGFYKVITKRASHDAFEELQLLNKNEVYSQTFYSFKVNSKEEGKSLISYLKCRLPNLLLTLRKMTHLNNESTLKWIPLVPLDKIWNDNLVYKYFKLNDNEIKLIDTIYIKGYKF